MKISKTLKRLRAERGITQEQLAEQLFISRQSVSSWENDRTQPDLEMLGRLSEVFGVSVEELVYGKKRNITLETEKPNYNSTLIIVFSILGSLLAGTGLVLIFVTFWQKMPLLIKTVLSLLPLIAGQGAGIFVLLRKKDKVPWCEGAGVLWCAGIAATLTMIYNVFSMPFYWYSLLVVQSILLLPVILLLKCVSPLIIYYSTAMAWFFIDDSADVYPKLAVTVILLIAGCFFTAHRVKAERKSIRSLCAHWLSILCTAVFLIIFSLTLSADFILAIIGTGAVGLCLLLTSFKEQDMAMPYRIPGLILTSLMLFGSGAYYYGNIHLQAENLVFTAVCLFAVLTAFAFGFISKTLPGDKFLRAYQGIAFLLLLVFSVLPYFLSGHTKGNSDELFITLMKIPALAANILLMISGGREKKLLPINTGFISVSALTFLIVVQSGFSMIINGLLLLVCGGVLLLINYKLSKKSAKIPLSENIREVQEND